jgi:hypothetical protein
VGGKKSKPTIGFWYKLAIHFLFGRAIEALLEIRGGDKTAASGYWDENQTIAIAAKNLWGGEKAEGGIEGDFDLMMGAADQAPNSYLGTVFGAKNPAFRGKATGVFKGGLYGAFNPYPKPMSFKVMRVLVDWPDDAPWYSATAKIIIGPDPAPSVESFDLNGQTNCGVSSAVGVTVSGYDPADVVVVSFPSGRTYKAWNGFGDDIGPHANAWTCNLQVTTSGGTTDYLPGLYANADDALAAAQAANISLTGYSSYTLWLGDFPVNDNRGGLSLTLTKQSAAGLIAMNPAHILYESVISPWGSGEPAGLINEASLLAAADKLFAEGFGLCMRFDPRHQTVEQFQRRIEQIIDGRFSQSRVDGQYYLTLIRDDYVLEDLEILTDDDILEFREEDSDPLESVNQVMVEWFDPVQKEKRITQPVNSLAAIRASGGIVSETGQYPEVPYEDLALRIAARDLGYKSRPAKRFSLTTNRRPYAWLGGKLFRLQAPRRGIADMVCLLGEVGAGVPRSGSMRIKASQFVAAARDSVYVVGEPGVDHTPSATPAEITVQALIEAPYVELAGRLSAADLDAMGDELGIVLAVAKQPDGGLSYALATGAGSEDLAERGYGDFCPTATVVESAGRDPGETTFTLTDGSLLEDVVVGEAALWGTEIVRVDALDTGTGAVTFGRGCADTTPQTHSAGERVWFYDSGAASDSREYSAGEVVHAKLLNRTSSDQVALADASEITLTVDGRKDRPYPPGLLEVDGVTTGAAASETFTVTWAHRDRLLQADQLVDSSMASVGPEQNTRYTIQVIDDGTDAVLVEASDLGEPTADVLLAADHAALRIEVWSVRDGLESWQRLVSEAFAYTAGAAGAAYAAANPGSDGQINGTTPADPDVPLQPYVEKTGDTMTGDLQLDLGDTAGGLAVSTDYGTVADVRWQSDGVDRWILRKNATDQLEVLSRNDDGTIRYVEATWDRATGVMNFRVAPTVGSAAIALQSYVDAAIAGLRWKQPVRVATTVAGTLASSFEAGDTIDGVVLVAGDRILIKNQAAGAENGIYTINASGAPTRATDADSGAELVNASCFVSEGSSNADTQWVCTNNATPTLGSTALSFAQFGTGSFDLPATVHAATSKAAPIDADELALVDTADSNALKKLTLANLAAYVWTKLGGLINGGTAKTSPVDADEIAIADSAASYAPKKLTLANLKTYLTSALGYVQPCYWDYTTRGSANLVLTAALKKVIQSGAGGWFLVRTIRMFTGAVKIYFEFKVEGSGALIVGISTPALASTTFVGQNSTSYGYRIDDGLKYNNNGSATYGSVTATTNDIIGCHLDLVNGKIFFAKNNTQMNSGDPVAGTNPAFSGLDNTQGFFISASTAAANAGCTLRTKASECTYSPQSGYSYAES